MKRNQDLAVRLLTLLNEAEATAEPVGLREGEEPNERDPLVLALRTAGAVLDERARLDGLLETMEGLTDVHSTEVRLAVARAVAAENHREVLIAELRRELRLKRAAEGDDERIEQIRQALRFCGIEVDD